MDETTLNTPLHLELNTELGIATLTLNRPEVRNAFDDTLIQQLSQTLETLKQDQSLRLLVLQGSGDHFSAGADLNWMRKMSVQSLAENQRDALALAQLMHNLYYFPLPTLGLIKGSVYGGGVGLVACCDIALASIDATFCLSETKLGLIPSVIAPYVMSAIGERAAKRYMLSAEPFSASTACHLGLIHEVVQAQELEPHLQHFITLLLQNGPEALLKTKEMIYTLSLDPQKHLLDMQYTANLIAEMRATPEAQKRLSQFLNKGKQ